MMIRVIKTMNRYQRNKHEIPTNRRLELDSEDGEIEALDQESFSRATEKKMYAFPFVNVKNVKDLKIRVHINTKTIVLSMITKIRLEE